MAVSTPSNAKRDLSPDVVGAAIDKKGVTRTMVFILVVGALGSMFDGMDNILLGITLPSIAKEFQLSSEMVGLLGTFGLIGMALGAWGWGYIADFWGRKKSFASTVTIYGLFAGLMAIGNGMFAFAPIRFICGLGLGGAMPVDAALVSEFAPTRRRGLFTTLVVNMIPVGLTLGALVGALLIPIYGWRIAFLIGLVPVLLLVFFRRHIPETPRWLALKGRSAEARVSLNYMGITDQEIAEAEKECQNKPVKVKKVAKFKLSDLWAPGVRRGLIVSCIVWPLMSINTQGMTTWLTSFFVSVYHIEITRSLNYTLMANGAAIIGGIIAILIVDRVGRKPLLIFGYVMAGISAACFMFVQSDTMLLMVAISYNFFLWFASPVIGTYVAEVFPTHIRAFGSSVAQGVARVIAAFAPLAIGIALGAKAYNSVWIGLAACLVIAALTVLVGARETKDYALEALSTEKEAAAEAELAPVH